VRAIFHREMVGTPKNVIVSKTPTGDYYASIQCERELEPPIHTGPAVGIDVGLKDLAVLSTGEKIPHPTHLRAAEKRLARLQRSLSRKKKGSKNREKARVLVARQHAHVANCRRDTLHHKLSDRLTRENSVLRMENLNIRGMLKNHTLAKGIADSGWGMLVSMCRYKAEWRGGVVEQIDRFYPSTKTCHVCGYKNDDLTLDDREWTCRKCGTTYDRDVNAARVILSAPVVPSKERERAAVSLRACVSPERRDDKPVEMSSDVPVCAGARTSMKRESHAL